MAEGHIGFLYNAASVIRAQSDVNDNYKKLRSYYLMRCKVTTRGYGLPKKHFSEKTRCSYCCLEWDNKTQIKLTSLKLSKRQRKRIRHNVKNKTQYQGDCLSNRNEMEYICTFCRKSLKIPITKPDVSKKLIGNNDKMKEYVIKPKENITKEKLKSDKQLQSSVYSRSQTVFNLNKQSALPNTVKTKPKVIKNSKKKKDRFAGLCQEAVKAATKLKQQKEKENTLNLFLKPSL